MTKENIQEFAVALNSSPGEGAGEGSEAKRNKKTQLLSALLSASALGVFLEGCGGGGGGFIGFSGEGDGSEENPYLATADADRIGGSGDSNWVSYADSNEGVNIDLSNNPATASGGWAADDTLTAINNLIGSRFDDTLTGNSAANTLRGGADNDILIGGSGEDILEGGAGQDDYIFYNGGGNDEIRIDPDGGKLLFRHASETDTFNLARDTSGIAAVIADGGSTLIRIADSAYQHGIYSLHVGSADTLIGHIHIGGNTEADTLTGGANKDLMSGFGGNDRLFGGGGEDIVDGGAGNDLLDGGGDSDLLYGDLGDDTYRFDAGDGVDYILMEPDLTGDNKVIFRALTGVTYTNDNFNFTRGTFQPQEGGDIVFGEEDFTFAESTSGLDLLIVVSQGGSTRNTVVVNEYFFETTDSSYDIYSIHRTGYNSLSDGTIVSTQPSEIA